MGGVGGWQLVWEGLAYDVGGKLGWLSVLWLLVRLATVNLFRLVLVLFLAESRCSFIGGCI